MHCGAGETLLPQVLAGSGLQATGHAGIGDNEEILVVSNRRGDVGGARRTGRLFSDASEKRAGPTLLRSVANVAGAIGLNAHEVELGKPGRKEYDVIRKHQPGD